MPLLQLTACSQLFIDQTQSGARPAILVQYHVWFRGNHACPYTGWYDWDGWVHSPDTNNPCTTPYGAPWLRQISAVVYPLIGPYKRMSEIYRWHIRLAKAAGITGFLVSTGPGGPQSCGGNENELRAAFMDMLKVAWEENFKIGFEGWKPTCASVSTFYDTIRSQIDEAHASPYASALLKIHGLTPYWFITYGAAWDTWANITSNLLNTRDVFWMVGGDQTQSELNTARAKLTNNAQLTRLASYNYVDITGCQFTEGFSTRMSDLASNGFIVITHGYPGFDERATNLGSNRYCPWNNYVMLNDFLNNSQTAGANYIILESWNDYTEWTNLEPAMDIKQYRDLGQEALYLGDPYRTLKQIAAWKGITWQTPFLPCAIVDPPLLEHGMVECTDALPPRLAP